MLGKKLKFKVVAKRNPWPHRELARALEPLEERVLIRYWLESFRLALLWGMAVTGVLLALAWVYPFYQSMVALGCGFLALTVVVALRYYWRPDVLTVVHVADQLGAQGAAVTSFRLLEAHCTDIWSRSATARGIAFCSGLSRDLSTIYPVVPRWRPWRDVALLALLLMVLQFVPNPLAPHWASVQREREELAVAAEKAQQTVADVSHLLPDEIRKDLAGLAQEVKQARDRREAAHQLEKAGWRLDEARTVIDTSARRDLNRLIAAWGGSGEKEWKQLAGALQRGDREQIKQAVGDLDQRLAKAGTEERKQMAAALFTGAAAVDNSALQKALRNVAGAGQAGTNSGAMEDLASALAGMAETVGAGDALGSASTNLSALASGLLGLSADGSALASGSSGASPGVTPGGDDGCTNPNCTQGNCDGNQCSDGTSNSGGSGNEDTSGTGSGGVGSGGLGAGTAGGERDLVYTPFLPDAHGQSSQVAGQVREGEQGSIVELDRSSTDLGAVRPYSEVYGRYLAEAHDSLGRAPLPPEMEDLVWRYFNSLNQEGG